MIIIGYIHFIYFKKKHKFHKTQLKKLDETWYRDHEKII